MYIKRPTRRYSVLQGDWSGAGLALLYVGVWRHMSNTYIIKAAAILNPGYSATLAQHPLLSTIALIWSPNQSNPQIFVWQNLMLFKLFSQGPEAFNFCQHIRNAWCGPASGPYDGLANSKIDWVQFEPADHSEDHSEGHLVRSCSPDRSVTYAHSAFYKLNSTEIARSLWTKPIQRAH